VSRCRSLHRGRRQGRLLQEYSAHGGNGMRGARTLSPSQTKPRHRYTDGRRPAGGWGKWHRDVPRPRVRTWMCARGVHHPSGRATAPSEAEPRHARTSTHRAAVAGKTGSYRHDVGDGAHTGSQEKPRHRCTEGRRPAPSGANRHTPVTQRSFHVRTAGLPGPMDQALMKSSTARIPALLLATLLAACTPADDAGTASATAGTTEISGAGASFIYPLVSKWSADYHSATGH